MHLSWSLVHEALGIEGLEHSRPFHLTQCARRARASSRTLLWSTPTVVRGPRSAERLTCRLDTAKVASGLAHRSHKLSSFKSSGRVCSTPRSSDIFFCTSMTFSAYRS